MSQSPNSHSPPSPYSVSRTLTVIGAIVIAEPLSATLLFPFVYFMVRGFNTVEERYVGYWAGLITAAFFVPQMLTATLWGIASDKLGRKPIMILGLLASAGCMVLFGLSGSLFSAMLSRALCGFFNGNAGVARTAVGELAHNARLNPGKAFSLFGFCSAIGYIIGPLVGGFLANPAERFHLKGPGDLFLAYPFLLPCLVSGCFNIVVSVVSCFLLDETNQKTGFSKRGTSGAPNMEEGQTEGTAEEDPLLANSKPDPALSSKSEEGTYSRLTTMFCILGIVCISFHAIIFDEIYAVFAATKEDVGLGFTSTNIATSLSLMGPVIFLAQLVLFPFLNKRFSALVLWRASAVVLAIVYPIFSLLPQVSIGHHGSSRMVQWAFLLTLLTVRFTANVVGYTSMAVLLNEVALPENRGAIMGLGQTAISLGRAVGPAIGGSIWSWSLGNGLPAPLDSHFLFLFELVLALAQILSSAGIKSKS